MSVRSVYSRMWALVRATARMTPPQDNARFNIRSAHPRFVKLRYTSLLTRNETDAMKHV